MQTTGPTAEEIPRLPLDRVAVVRSRYYPEVTDALSEGARKTFERAGTPSSRIDLFHVGGSFELPQASQFLARSGRYACIVAVGCLVRGETPHFDYIARSVVSGLDEVGRTTGVPVALAVLTVDTLEQAKARAGGRFGNKGEEAARAALALVLLARELKRNGKPPKSA
jgi:6,7-dimethyl-8-ribityllumazine synthase